MRGNPDKNQSEIVEALRNAGFTVSLTHGVGFGFPDLVVGRAGKNFLLEVKDPAKRGHKHEFTPSEHEWMDNWRGSYSVVYNVDDALRAVGVYE